MQKSPLSSWIANQLMRGFIKDYTDYFVENGTACIVNNCPKQAALAHY